MKCIVQPTCLPVLHRKTPMNEYEAQISGVIQSREMPSPRSLIHGRRMLLGGTFSSVDPTHPAPVSRRPKTVDDVRIAVRDCGQPTLWRAQLLLPPAPGSRRPKTVAPSASPYEIADSPRSGERSYFCPPRQVAAVPRRWPRPHRRTRLRTAHALASAATFAPRAR